MCVNNLPTVVTWKRNSRDLNLRPFESQVQRSNHYATRPHCINKLVDIMPVWLIFMKDDLANTAEKKWKMEQYS